jgi:uncharacterized protein YndB with AHSA1/START domain
VSHLSTTIHVDAPPELVFDLIADPTRAPEWQTLLSDMGEISGRPGGVGSSYAGYYRVAWRRVEARFVVTAAERPRIHQAAGTARGGWARWTTLIDPANAGADVRVTLEYELPGELVRSVLGALTGTRLQRAFHRTYLNLKRLAEADARELGAGAGHLADGPQAAAHIGAE